MSKNGTETTQAGAGLIEQFKHNAAQRRRAAAERYHELLLRSDEPRTGDAADLGECMAVLGRSEADLEGDIEVARRIVATAQAERKAQALMPQFKEARAERGRVLAWAEEQRAKLESRISERVEAANKALASVRATYRASAAVAGEAQQAHDLWECIVSGSPLTAIQAARRAQKAASPPRQQTRDEIIQARRRETVTLRLFPLDSSPDGVVSSVDAALVAAKHAPLSEAEITEHGVRGWLAEADGRLPAEKELQAQPSGVA